MARQISDCLAKLVHDYQVPPTVGAELVLDDDGRFVITVDNEPSGGRPEASQEAPLAEAAAALDALVALVYVPLAHSSAADAPLPQCAPRSHAMQPVAFAAGWYRPPGHASHTACCDDAATVPALHATGATAPSVHAEPAGQSTHAP